MKKIIIIASAALMALCCISCNKELKTDETIKPGEEQLSKGKVHMTFTAGIGTKASVVEGENTIDIKWSDDDHIAVWDGTEWCNFEATSVDGATAVFEGDITPDESFATTDFKAVYPYSAVTDNTNSAISITVPDEQTIPAGGVVDPAALVSVATCSEAGLLTFEQVCALVKVGVATEGMSTITLEGTGLAGTVVCNSDGSVATSTALENKITLTSADGTFATSDYYLAVLPGTSETLKVGIVSESDGYTGIRSTTTSVTFAQGEAIVHIKDSAISGEYNISTPEQLSGWNTHRNVSFTGNVNILADIDMTGLEWDAKDFSGKFNGNDHKIYNMVISSDENACFINSLSGSIKDISFGTSDGTTYDGTSAIVQDNPADDGTSWRYAGIVTRLNEDAVLDNVTSFVPVSVAETSASKTRVGGLVGIVAGAASISNCSNYGDVTIAATNQATAGAVGGIVGWTDAVLTAKSVTNNGNITVSNATTSYIGGILSTDEVGGSFTDCTNNGIISISSTGTRAMCVGGILGDATRSSLTNCSNSGSISCTCDGELKAGGIIGRAYKGCTIKDCINTETGTIYFNPESATKRAFIGGIVGNSPAANTETLTIDGCKNYASLEGVNAQVASISGIAGYLNGAGVVIIKDCENHGEMSNTNAAAKNGTSASEAFVSGIVAYLNTSLAAGSTIEGCINRGDVSTTNRNIKSIAGIIPLLQTSNAVTLKGCHNYGKINRNVNIKATISADSGSNFYYSIGGVVGRLDLGEGGSVSDCHNHAAVWANAAGGGAIIRIAGVVGFVIKCPEIKNCSNDGSITYENNIVQGSYIGIGGVAGHMYSTGVFDGCSNSGTISSNRSQVNRIGGVIGSVNNTPVTNCTNTGSVNLESVTETNNNWESAGGIAGFAEGSEDELAFTGNVNRGNVDATVTTSNARVQVGGILGMAVTPYNISNNENYGSITGVNNHASSPNMQVGGILGSNVDNSAVEQTLSGNVNYGAITNNVTNAAFAFAGGLYGKLDKADGASGSNFGIVTGLAAGAVAGSNTSAISATLCDAVTVNGVTKANASDEAAWLCPSNTGTITPTYVAHSASE